MQSVVYNLVKKSWIINSKDLYNSYLGIHLWRLYNIMSILNADLNDPKMLWSAKVQMVTIHQVGYILHIKECWYKMHFLLIIHPIYDKTNVFIYIQFFILTKMRFWCWYLYRQDVEFSLWLMLFAKSFFKCFHSDNLLTIFLCDILRYQN